MRCCSPKSKIFRMTSVPRASVAPPRWWSRTPRPVPDVTGGVAADGITVHTTAADGSPAPVHARYAIKSETVELGDMPGRIIREARGVHGFGYDPLFVPDDQPAGRVSTEPDHEGEPLTSAEMTPAEKNAISHRGKALKALVPAIEALLH